MLIDSTPARPPSQNKVNKLLEKDLKETILSLDLNELISLFRNLEIEAQVTSLKEFTKIGLKCSECHTKFDTFQSKGYGRDEHEALINSLKIILESMISSGYKIETIKKALKYSSKFKQPLINSNQQSSAKKSFKKVEGMDSNIKSTKKHLEFDSFIEYDKENMSIRMNEQSSSTLNQTNSKLLKSSDNNILPICNFEKVKDKKDKRVSSPAIIMEKTEPSEKEIVEKCVHSEDAKKCIFYDIQLHSEEEIKNLNARIKLLEEENSILKELLLKDFNRTTKSPVQDAEETQV